MLTDWSHELLDLKEPKYIYESRAIQVHWTIQENVVESTSIPPKIFWLQKIVTAYFELANNVRNNMQ